MENDIRKIPRLQGWDDEKIYFYDEKNIEYCIHDNEEVYRILLEMCIMLFRTGGAKLVVNDNGMKVEGMGEC